MNVLITGASGLVGKALINTLKDKGHQVSVLSRSKKNKLQGVNSYVWNPAKGELEEAALSETEVIIHLAGAGVADKRWTAAYKKEILDSRVLSTRLLAEKLATLPNRVKVWINASATGFYGMDTGDQLVDESSKAGDDFLANVVRKWETEVAKGPAMRKVILRFGIVLSAAGGALPKMALPVRFGIGSPMGSGKQYISWIDLSDLTQFMAYAIENERVEGIFNAVAPQPQTNEAFTKAIGKQLNRPVWLPNIPGFVLKLAVGEMSESLLGGNRVSAQKLLSTGFEFKYPTVEQSLAHHFPKPR